MWSPSDIWPSHILRTPLRHPPSESASQREADITSDQPRSDWCLNASSETLLPAEDDARIDVVPVTNRDALRYQEFIRGLSKRSRRYRFNYAFAMLSNSALAHLTDVDQERHVALLAWTASTGRVVGEVRYIADTSSCAEFAVVVADTWQRQGLGRSLMLKIEALARTNGVRRLYGCISAENEGNDPPDEVPWLRRCRAI